MNDVDLDKELLKEIVNELDDKNKNLLKEVIDKETKPNFDGAQYTTTVKYLRMSDEVIKDHLFNKGYTFSDFMIKLVHPTTFLPCVATVLNPPSYPVSPFYSLPLYVIIDLELSQNFDSEQRTFLKMPEIQNEAEIVNEARDWIIETEKPKIIDAARDSVIDDFMKSQSYWQRIKNIFW